MAGEFCDLRCFGANGFCDLRCFPLLEMGCARNLEESYEIHTYSKKEISIKDIFGVFENFYQEDFCDLRCFLSERRIGPENCDPTVENRAHRF